MIMGWGQKIGECIALVKHIQRTFTIVAQPATGINQTVEKGNNER